MTVGQLKEKYLKFFEERGHQKLANVSLVPENDPTALFINSGMHPLVPYLLGEPHPLGKKLVSLQRCLRTQDIEEVGDFTHLTFFEMLGNWSLGDYWKKEAIAWSYEFLTSQLGLDPKRLSVTCFAGDQDAPKDEETAKIWRSLGLPKERIHFLGKKDNWWAVGDAGPCGPDTEMFYDTGKKKCGPKCQPGCSCGKYFEVWNNVFMQFNKSKNGKLEKLKKPNIDTGMGVERMMTILEGKDDVYQISVLVNLIEQIEKIAGQKYQGKNQKPMRIIADHLRAAVFALADGVLFSNVGQGYVLRRLVRRTIRYSRFFEAEKSFLAKTVPIIVDQYSRDYPHLKRNQAQITRELKLEEERFKKTLKRGLKEIEKYKSLNGKIAFYLYETHGFPLELTEEIARERDQKLNKQVFEKEFKKHQKLSRKGVAKKFTGGLADHSGVVKKLHTATHLLHQALRDVLGDHVCQSGSNITPERARFDFTHPEKLSDQEIEKVAKLVNQKIEDNLPVKMKIMSLEEAKKKGALAFFGEKYGEKVKVYSVGGYSKEICGGPHISFTGEIGHVKITKEESVGAGRRRIYLQPA